MPSKTLLKFRQLPQEQRSMVFIFWIYKFVAILSDLFLAVFVYLKTDSILSLAAYYGVYHTALVLGFVGFGWCMGRLKLSVRYNYLRAFGCLFLAAILLIALPHTFSWLLLFAAVNGFGNGLMWLTIHTLELVHTKNSERDFYSSVLELGNQIMIVLSPFVAAASFFISETYLHTETYFLLFLILPLAILSALPFLFRIPHFIPERVRWSHIKQLIPPNHTVVHAFYVSDALLFGFQWIAIPVLAIHALKTPLNLGLLETLLGFISVVVIVFLSHVRRADNRIKLMLQAVYLYLVAYLFLFFFDLSPIFYIAYALFVVVLRPVLRVCQHVIHLDSVERLANDGMSFFPMLLYRDVVLWVGRMMVPLAFVGLSVVLQNEILLLKLAVFFMALFLFLSWLCARWVAKTNDEKATG